MGKMVLIVEDNLTARDHLQCNLRLAGCNFMSFDNGRAAWDFLREGGKCDVIISDYEMPRMTGVELLSRVKATGRIADMPFVLMSGRVTVSDDDQTSLEALCAKLGATFVAKPVDCETLIAQLLG